MNKYDFLIFFSLGCQFESNPFQRNSSWYHSCVFMSNRKQQTASWISFAQGLRARVFILWIEQTRCDMLQVWKGDLVAPPPAQHLARSSFILFTSCPKASHHWRTCRGKTTAIYQNQLLGCKWTSLTLFDQLIDSERSAGGSQRSSMCRQRRGEAVTTVQEQNVVKDGIAVDM